MRRISLVALAAVAFAAPASAAPSFTHDPPGQLVPGSGEGRVDDHVYAPDIRFPIESAPAYANSQVWGRGGMNGGGGTQCDAQNFSYPWHDNYCETRSWDMPLCPAGEGHQGQDIRAASCKDRTHWVVAVVDGTITHIGSYTVYLTAADGTRYDYLHMADVAVKEGDKVVQGQHVGKVSNQFDGSSTTIHLHFNVRQNVAGVGEVFVPPYPSLVQSYEYLIGIRTHEPADAGDAEPPPAPPAPPPPAASENAAPLPDDAPSSPPPETSSGGCIASRPAGGDAGALAAAFAIALGIVVRRRRGR